MDKGCSPSRLLLVFLRLSSAGRHRFPARARMQSKRLRKVVGEGGNQAPSPQRDGCRTFLGPRAEERRGAANASRWIYFR